MKRAVALSFSLLFLGAGFPAAVSAEARLEDLVWDFQLVPLGGQTPPPFTLESLDGKTVSLADFHGRPVLLYFWRST